MHSSPKIDSTREAFCFYGEYPRPVVVIGPGRCGTSFVAQCLTEMDVFMGYKLKKGDPGNPDGYFEDVEFIELNESFERKNMDRWHQKLSRIIRQRRNLGIPWGFKDPKMCHLLEEYLKQVNPIFIRLRRTKDQVVQSMANLGTPMEKASVVYEIREKSLDTHLKGRSVLKIQCPDGLKDKARLKSSMRDYLDNFGIVLTN